LDSGNGSGRNGSAIVVVWIDDGGILFMFSVSVSVSVEMVPVWLCFVAELMEVMMA
jgi:hypothetical protein